MKISVAMATYNGEKYIYKQLESLLKQTRKAEEIIIVDDNSTDNTACIVRDFIAKNTLHNWSFYINDKNMGFIKNFKNIISKTSGDIIFLCDQDDIWLPKKIEKLEMLFKENPQALAINSSFNLINENDKKYSIAKKNNWSNQNIIHYKIPEKEFTQINFSTIIRDNISPGCTMAFKSSMKEKIADQVNLEIPHDWEINLYAAVYDGLYFLNTPLINYRIHNSNTIGLSTENQKDLLKIKGNYDKRISVLRTQIGLCRLLLTPLFYMKADNKNKSYVNHAYKFSLLRMEVLKNNSGLAWLRLWAHVPFINKDNTIKMIFGDLVFILNMQKFFKKK